MKTKTKWNPPTLADALSQGLVVNIPMLAPISGKPEKVKYLCDCGVYAWPWQFDDVRGISGIDQAFICDGCYTKLERNLVDIDGDGKPDTTREFKQRFLKQQSAPKDLQKEIGKKLDRTGKEKQ